MSEIKVSTISDKAGTGPATLTGQYAARAWANYVGTGTPAVSDSFNVSSLTDLATGRQAPSWTNNFTTANYSIVSASPCTALATAFTNDAGPGSSDLAAGSAEVFVGNGSSMIDSGVVCCVAHGDLA